MSVYSDGAIKKALASGDIVIHPLNKELIQPSSIDVRLGSQFRIFRNHRAAVIDPKQQNNISEIVECDDAGFVLHPGEFALATTIETIKLPAHLVARLEGKSSLGRLGLIIHATAGYIDPGFEGQITLEMSNVANLPIILYPGMRIGQLSFHELTSPAERPYGSEGIGKYQSQQGPTESRIHKDILS